MKNGRGLTKVFHFRFDSIVESKIDELIRVTGYAPSQLMRILIENAQVISVPAIKTEIDLSPIKRLDPR